MEDCDKGGSHCGDAPLLSIGCRALEKLDARWTGAVLFLTLWASPEPISTGGIPSRLSSVSYPSGQRALFLSSSPNYFEVLTRPRPST
jgi:hypothetical protein